MAENIYSKGTRVWFEDKEQAWISAEVASVTKATDDSIKLVFVDERGKVLLFHFNAPILDTHIHNFRKSRSIRLGRKSKTAKKVFRHYEILLC